MLHAMPHSFLRLAPGVEATTCPKCLHPSSGDACAKCGLLASRAAQFIAPLGNRVPADLLDAWRATRQGWSTRDYHERVLRLAGQHSQYAWLACRYRELARRGDDIAHKRLELVQRAAELTLFVSLRKREAAEPAPYQATRRMLVAMLLVLVIGAILTRVAVGAH